MLQCLTDIIGITKSDCQCIVNGLTSDQQLEIKKSVSDLYLDDLEGGVQMKALNSVDACKSFYKLATAAKNEAIKRVETDVIVALNNRYKKDKQAYAGPIGRMSFTQSLGVARSWQGVRLRPRDYSDAVITINKLQIIVNAAVGLTVRVFRVYEDSVMGEQVAAWPVTTNVNAYTLVPIGAGPIKLPLVYDGQAVEYYVMYDTTEPGTPVLPKDNTIICGSCTRGIAPYSDFVTVEGVQLNNPNTLNDKIIDSYSHGLILDVSIKCDNEKLMCREYAEDDAVAVVLANAVRYKAGELLIESVSQATDINRYTTMKKEYLWGKRNHFRAEYEARIVYLAQVINVSSSNCYICREQSNQPFLAPILI